MAHKAIYKPLPDQKTKLANIFLFHVRSLLLVLNRPLSIAYDLIQYWTKILLPQLNE